MRIDYRGNKGLEKRWMIESIRLKIMEYLDSVTKGF